MKSLMVLGALVGFLAGIALGMERHGDWSAILWRSMLSALLLSWLLRWWGQRWLRCLREAQQERLAALLAQRRETKPTPAKKT